jgi:hypothetical protein
MHESPRGAKTSVPETAIRAMLEQRVKDAE